MLAAIPNENITSSELYSILLRIDMATWAIGAALPYLRTSDLAKVPLDHIDFGELPSTANIIESLSLLEDENFAKISLMNEISQVFFHQWFQKVDRENLPIGWERGKLSDLARLSKLTINPQKFPQKEFLHYSIPAFDSGLGPDVTLGADIHSNKFTIQEKCVLLSKLNPRTCRVWVSSTSSEITSICSTEFLPLIPNEEVPIAYLYHLLTSPSFRWLLKSWVTGTTNSHQRVRPEEVMNLPCVIPPVNIMKRFGEFSSSELNLSSSTLEQDKTSSEVKFQFL
jgi:type I restriction enzyme S subunit